MVIPTRTHTQTHKHIVIRHHFDELKLLRVLCVFVSLFDGNRRFFIGSPPPLLRLSSSNEATPRDLTYARTMGMCELHVSIYEAHDNGIIEQEA